MTEAKLGINPTFPALSDCTAAPLFPPFGRSNRLSTLFKLAVMQLTQSATHNAADTAKVDFPDVAELSAQLLIMFVLVF